MATPSGNGVFVVTQYIPASSTNTVQQTLPVSQTPCFLQKFIRGEPKSLGAVQIMIGITYILLGGILCSNGFHIISASSGIPFWGGLLFIISGGMSISAEKKGTIRMVKSSSGMNIFSAIIAGIGSIIYACDSDIDYDDHYSCGSYKHYREACWLYRDRFLRYHVGVLVVLVLLSLLEFCVSITSTCYGCKSLPGSSYPQDAQPLFAVQNHYMQDPRVLSTHATGMPGPQGVPVGQGMPVNQGMVVLYGKSMVPGIPSGIPPAQGIESAVPTAPPPTYYRDVPGDSSQP